jgi:thioredoxin reductase (NADPH)
MTIDTPVAPLQTTALLTPPAPPARLRLLDRGASTAGHELRVFLGRNRIPFEWDDVGSAPVTSQQLPLVVFPDGTWLEAPSRLELARRAGLHTRPSRRVYDLAIIGGGPAGLAAAVYGASEGLTTVVVERDAPGGQAGASTRIENYPGFPSAISGQELTDLTLSQARRFGAEVVIANEVAAADAASRAPFCLTLRDGTDLCAHAVIVATGVAYRLLEAPGVAELVGKGICYGHGVSEAPLLRGRDVFVAGGANSAGQAALHFAQFARHVTLLVRGESLADTMSQYLIDQLAATENVSVVYRTEVARAEGGAQLEGLALRDRDTGAETRVAADGLAVMIGHRPATQWAEGILSRDEQGFLLTGKDLFGPAGVARGAGLSPNPRVPGGRHARQRARWPLRRDPLFLETSVPGVFVAGDVRHGSTKRVAAAVGEGAIAVRLVHQYLGEVAAADAQAMRGAALRGPKAAETLRWDPPGDAGVPGAAA